MHRSPHHRMCSVAQLAAAAQNRKAESNIPLFIQYPIIATLNSCRYEPVKQLFVRVYILYFAFLFSFLLQYIRYFACHSAAAFETAQGASPALPRGMSRLSI